MRKQPWSAIIQKCCKVYSIVPIGGEVLNFAVGKHSLKINCYTLACFIKTKSSLQTHKVKKTNGVQIVISLINWDFSLNFKQPMQWFSRNWYADVLKFLFQENSNKIKILESYNLDMLILAFYLEPCQHEFLGREVRCPQLIMSYKGPNQAQY